MNVNRLFSSESPASKYSYVLIASLLFLIFWLINGNSSSNHKWESDNYDPLAKHQPQAQAHRRTSLKNHQDNNKYNSNNDDNKYNKDNDDFNFSDDEQANSPINNNKFDDKTKIQSHSKSNSNSNTHSSSSVRTQCSWRFSHYTPSSFELDWYSINQKTNDLRLGSFSICEKENTEPYSTHRNALTRRQYELIYNNQVDDSETFIIPSIIRSNTINRHGRSIETEKIIDDVTHPSKKSKYTKRHKLEANMDTSNKNIYSTYAGNKYGDYYDNIVVYVIYCSDLFYSSYPSFEYGSDPADILYSLMNYEYVCWQVSDEEDKAYIEKNIIAHQSFPNGYDMDELIYERQSNFKNYLTSLTVVGRGAQLIEPLAGSLRDSFDWPCCEWEREYTCDGHFHKQLQREYIHPNSGKGSTASKDHILYIPLAPYTYDTVNNNNNEKYDDASTLSKKEWFYPGLPPWLYGVANDRPRTYVFDFGSAYFREWSALSGSHYSGYFFYRNLHLRGIKINSLYAFEYSPLDMNTLWQQIPDEFIGLYSIVNQGVGKEGKFHPWTIIKRIVKKNDFVLVKLDIDTASIEVPLAYELLTDTDFDNPIHELIDELHYEDHVMFNDMPQRNNTHARSQGMERTIYDSQTLFYKLRQKGIRAHQWP